MKFSQLYCTPQKDAKEYASLNATLLIKAGFVYQTLAGAYSILPLGLRVLNKIEQIIREEMDNVATELYLTNLSPQKNWRQTGRLETVDVLMKTTAANKVSLQKSSAGYILNPTHEDVLTPIVQQFAQSYRDLPVALYQIQTKFRNEARAKSGLLRGREFRMKDLYSFHASETDLLEYYEQMKDVYIRIFDRLGLGDDTVICLASGGDFTKNYSHEFQTKLDNGEDLIFYSQQSQTYFNKEVAPAMAPRAKTELPLSKEKVETPGITGMDQLVDFLHVKVEQCVKTMLYQTASGKMVAAAVRGNYDINEIKLRKILGESVQLASEQQVEKVTGAELGYAGLIDLPDEVEVLVDESLESMTNFECGANQTNYHWTNLNWERDLPKPAKFFDIKVTREGDLDPGDGQPLTYFKASEVGNIFPLNTKFSKSFNYTYTDRQGKQQLVYMGSYGIGTTRIMGVIVEKFADERGIVWPKAIAPYQVHLVSLPGGEGMAQKLYDQLQARGVEILWDDREVAAGIKFNDCDLIGIPTRLVVSAKTGDQVEWKERTAQDSVLLSFDEVLARFN